ncbi:MAG: DUF3572 family protein [Rhodobacteraceae bacterium]|nr:DUF3572 family protein [Paracoccaceae bacterium]
MKTEQAEILGAQALAWLANSDDLLPVFLGATGADGADLRGQADRPEFLGSVLDFLMMDDAWVIAFCDAHSLPYDTLMRARQALPGGQDVSWT